MLTLRRREGEEIVLTVPAGAGPVEIVVRVQELSQGRARLGIEAPIDVRILRAELLPARKGGHHANH